VIRRPVTVEKPGVFTIELNYSMVGEENWDAEVRVGEKKVPITIRGGQGLEVFKTEKSGELSIDKPGDLEFTLRSLKAPGGFVMHLRSMTLIPKVVE
jgi:hypothetical protein